MGRQPDKRRQYPLLLRYFLTIGHDIGTPWVDDDIEMDIFRSRDTPFAKRTRGDFVFFSQLSHKRRCARVLAWVFCQVDWNHSRNT